jgi:hypothetical protein
MSINEKPFEITKAKTHIQNLKPFVVHLYISILGISIKYMYVNYPTQHDRVSQKKRCIIKNINLFCLSTIDTASSDTQLQVFTKKSPAWHIQWNWQSSENYANEQEGVPVFKIFLSSQSVKFFNQFQYNPSINILKYNLSLKKQEKLFIFLLNFLIKVGTQDRVTLLAYSHMSTHFTCT